MKVPIILTRHFTSLFFLFFLFLFFEGVTYKLNIKSGYPPDGFHSYQAPTKRTEGTFTNLTKANAACRKVHNNQRRGGEEER